MWAGIRKMGDGNDGVTTKKPVVMILEQLLIKLEERCKI
jgi:hypothetical protein